MVLCRDSNLVTVLLQERDDVPYIIEVQAIWPVREILLSFPSTHCTPSLSEHRDSYFDTARRQAAIGAPSSSRSPSRIPLRSKPLHDFSTGTRSGPTQAHTTFLRRGQTGLHAFANEGALELGHAGEHGEQELRHGVAIRPHVQPLLDSQELHAGIGERADVRQEVQARCAKRSKRVTTTAETFPRRAASSTRCRPGRLFLAPEPVSAMASAISSPRFRAAASSSAIAVVGSCPAVETRLYTAARACRNPCPALGC